MTNNIFSERLRAVLDLRGMPQSELARRAGLTFTTINTLARGRCLPNAYTLIKVVEVLDVSADYLLGLSNIMESRKEEDNEFHD